MSPLDAFIIPTLVALAILAGGAGLARLVDRALDRAFGSRRA